MGSLTPLQRCIRCILQPQLTGPLHSLIVYILDWIRSFGCFISYIPLWMIYYESHLSRRTKVILCNPYLEGIWRFYFFLYDIRTKVNVIAWLEFELTYYDATDQHVSHDASKTPHTNIVMSNFKLNPLSVKCTFYSAPTYLSKFLIWEKRTSRYIPTVHGSYKAYSRFHTETGTTTTVFDVSDNLHG